MQPEPIHRALTTYFDGEKNAGLMLFGVGLVVVTGAMVLFPSRWDLRSFAVTLAVFGLLEVAIGAGLYLKTGPQVERLVLQLTNEPAAFYAMEGPRMTVVQRNFVILESVWLALIAGSAIAAIWQKRSTTIAGIAFGVLVNVAVFLAFDIIAERRGDRYVQFLSLRTAVRPD
jgi:hypothetical protein